MCPICLVDFEEDDIEVKAAGKSENGIPTAREILCCGHQFHQTCISTWLKKKNSCPICRQDNPREPPSEEGESSTLLKEEKKVL